MLTLTWALAITGTAAGLGDIANTRDDHHAGHHDGAADHHEAIQHDTGASTATSPRPQPDRPSEVAHADPQPEVVEETEPASTVPESSEDHTHAPGEEH